MLDLGSNPCLERRRINPDIRILQTKEWMAKILVSQDLDVVRIVPVKKIVRKAHIAPKRDFTKKGSFPEGMRECLHYRFGLNSEAVIQRI